MPRLMKAAASLALLLCAATPAVAKCPFLLRWMDDDDGRACADFDRFKRMSPEEQQAKIAADEFAAGVRERKRIEGEEMAAQATLCIKAPSTDTCSPEVNDWLRKRSRAAAQR